MTRTAIRHTLSALAAVALVSAVASSPASAQSNAMNGNALNGNAVSGNTQSQTQKGLATKKPAAHPKALARQQSTQPRGGGYNKVMMFVNASQAD